uniref:Thrombopoietin n=1 Tax=Sinocyclocheilus anshuiensis TaxID=1608454 RepID=A0A671RWT8_9TELE
MHQNSQSNLGEKISESVYIFACLSTSETFDRLCFSPPLQGVCSAVDALPSDIKLPCIRIHKATWERKSVHEQRAEILLSLGTLAQDVRSARTLSQTGCGLTLLERLEHSINNYLHVVRLLHIEGEQVGPQAELCLGQPSKHFGLVLKHFGLLLTGKLEWLIAEMAKRC